MKSSRETADQVFGPESEDLQDLDDRIQRDGEAILFRVGWRNPFTGTSGWMIWSPDLPEQRYLPLRGRFTPEAAKTSAELLLCRLECQDFSDWQTRSAENSFSIRYNRGGQSA